jgi:hypothetical protein
MYLKCVAVPADVLQHADKDAQAQHDEYSSQGEGGAPSTKVTGDDDICLLHPQTSTLRLIDMRTLSTRIPEILISRPIRTKFWANLLQTLRISFPKF